MENEMSKPRELGGSLPVANVQALAGKDLKSVPERYLRPELQSDFVASIDNSREIPVIDLSRLLDEKFATEELVKLHSACEDWGFFQLINHGASEEIIEKMKIDIQEFFKLPLEEKKVYSQPPNSNEGYGHAFVVSEEQKLDWSDMLFLISLPEPERNLKLWPNNPASFRGTLHEYSLELKKVVGCLTGLMAKNLGVELDKFNYLFENCNQGIRMNYYPPCPNPDKVIGLSPHSDATAITLLIQINEVEGLQIRKDGNWVPIKPIPGAFIVNIGDVMEILSNGKYKSIEHRGVIDPKKERLSVAAFHGPNFNSMIGPFSELVKENGVRYKTVKHEDYVKQVFSSKLDGKNTVDFMKLIMC